MSLFFGFFCFFRGNGSDQMTEDDSVYFAGHDSGVIPARMGACLGGCSRILSLTSSGVPAFFWIPRVRRFGGMGPQTGIIHVVVDIFLYGFIRRLFPMAMMLERPMFRRPKILCCTSFLMSQSMGAFCRLAHGNGLRWKWWWICLRGGGGG